MSDLFPLREYRTADAKDNAVKAKITSAQIVEINTNLTGASAATLATSILNATKNSAQSYTLTVEGIVRLSDLVGAMARVSLTYGSISGYVAKVTSLKIDWAKQQTTLTVRGTA